MAPMLKRLLKNFMQRSVPVWCVVIALRAVFVAVNKVVVVVVFDVCQAGVVVVAVLL